MTKHACIYIFDLQVQVLPFTFFDIASHKAYYQLQTGLFSSSPLCKALQSDESLHVSCYFSGKFLKNLETKSDELDLLQRFVKAGQIELIAGSYAQSLSSLFSKEFFIEEISEHKSQLKRLFDYAPKGFVNTHAIYSDGLLSILENEGFEYCVAPRVSWYLPDANASVFKSINHAISLVLIGDTNATDAATVVSYLDGSAVRYWELETLTLSEVTEKYATDHIYSLPDAVGLSTNHKDLTQLLGNVLQKQYFKRISKLASKIYPLDDAQIREDYLMMASPSCLSAMDLESSNRHEVFTWLMNSLTDLELRSERNS